MQSSKVRFKLYKAKKNWVSAGLVTTAVLAGLTLGSVKNNDVVAHADATPVATQTADQKVDTPKATETKSDVQKTTDQINKVKDEVANVQKANEANKDVQPTTDADKAASQDKQIVNNHKAAKDALKDAQATQTQAGKDVDNATTKANNAKAAVKEAGQNLDKASYNQKDAKAAQESYDDNQNAITDADKDMDTNIRPAKEKADKAYNDQLAYQKQLEDGLSRFGQDLKNKQDAEKAAQKKVDDTNNAITDADNDLHDNITPAKDAAHKAYNDAVNDQNVKYIDAMDTAKADQEAAAKTNQKAVDATNAANALKQAAQNAVTSAQNALAAANHQLSRDMSAWRHDRSHLNAVAVNNSKRAAKAAEAALTAAQHNLNNMNNYDALKNAQVADQNATKALEDANAAVANDNSEYNQEAQSAAQAAADTAATNLTNAKNSFVNDNDTIAKYVSAKDNADAAQAPAAEAAAKATNSQNAAAALKNAAQTALNNAQRQYQREISGYRHNPTHENAVRVNNAKQVRDNAQNVVDNMNNYDAYLVAKDNENAKLDALNQAQQADQETPSDWTEEALDQAQSEYSDAQDAAVAARAKVADKLNLANSRPSLKKAMDDADKAYDDQVAYINQLEDGLSKFSNDLNSAKQDVKDAQKKVDDTRNAITDADNDMHDNIAPAKAKADKAYNDQLAYQQMLEDHLNKVTGPQLQEANKELDEANQAVKDASDKLTAANNDKIAADNNLTAAKQNKDAADDLVADAQSAMDTADDLVDEKVPSYVKGNDSQDTTKDDQGDVNTDVSNNDQKVAPAAKTATTMTRAEYRAQQNNTKTNSNKLPQTGSEDSAAVMALGAVSAMLGLGLAAKKREA
ncbi:KxYKxGKxW signal peptide domain-containing protein [uncultured Limosilactobacillus sp.]|uniref:KxYKxGKxW signal peptide domain-containing protein n=1 Tax=uncultured Limosilactobacillus sp. TaxID=2837629 RepID=UPI0025DE7BDA|nr:KxYKxGKxW signal peptide domain-containing protein [uncultured Limosilactobacillus sp.]